MKVRYHIVPKAKRETAMLIETNDKAIEVKNVLSSEEAFKLLHNRLDNWYKSKHIQAHAVTVKSLRHLGIAGIPNRFMIIRQKNLLLPVVMM